MHHSSIPEKPLVVSANSRVVKPQRCFFFERPDGSIINVEANEAWTLYRGRNQVIGEGRQRYKYIGQSDGTIFIAGLNNARQMYRETGDLAASQKCIKDAEAQELEVAKLDTRPPVDQDKFGDGREFI